MMLSATGLKFDSTQSKPITPLTANELFKGHAFISGDPYKSGGKSGGHDLMLPSAVQIVQENALLNRTHKPLKFDEEDIKKTRASCLRIQRLCRLILLTR